MQWARWLVVVWIGLLGVSCRQQDLRTTTIRCPRVGSATSVRLVTDALANVDGVLPGSIRCDTGAVTVSYDSMKIAVKNLEFLIAEAGFDAGEFPANAKAQAVLPADCR